MAKLSIEERRLKALAELKKLAQEEKQERAEKQTKLGQLFEKYFGGEIDHVALIAEAESVSGQQFKGEVPKQVFKRQEPVVIPTE
jgi:hypothetical protein